jgi:hypothetical protein
MNKGASPRGEHRSSALWGTENRHRHSRSNALWGKGGRGLVTGLVALLVVGAPLAAGAGKDGRKQRQLVVAATTYVDPILIAKAQTAPEELVRVVIQENSRRSGSTEASRAFRDVQNRSGGRPAERLKDRFPFMGSVAVTIRAKRVYELARIPDLTVTTTLPSS